MQIRGSRRSLSTTGSRDSNQQYGFPRIFTALSNLYANAFLGLELIPTLDMSLVQVLKSHCKQIFFWPVLHLGSTQR